MRVRSLHTDIMPRPTGLIQHLDQHLHRAQILARTEHLLIACSGGADSVALTHLIHAVSQSNHWHWKLRLVHVNHRTRPGENELDEALVRRLASQLSIPLNVVRLRPSQKPRGENDLRQLRWEKFLAVAKRYRCTCILTAHHADDQAETFLMRLMRGAGVHGLGAIRPKRRRGSTKIVRPLLHIPKKRLVAYLSSHNIPWREDTSNANIHYLRNRIRRDILPALTACQPQIAMTLVKTATQMRSVQRIINRHAGELADQLQIRGGKKPLVCLNRDILRRADALVMTECLRRWLIALGVSADRLSYLKMEELRFHIVRRASGLTVMLSDFENIRISPQEVRFQRSPTHKSQEVYR